MSCLLSLAGPKGRVVSASNVNFGREAAARLRAGTSVDHDVALSI